MEQSGSCWVAFYFLESCTYVGCPESVRTLKIARHCVDLAGRCLLSSNEFDELRRENRIALSCLIIVLCVFM
jgi:hypothetical protein